MPNPYTAGGGVSLLPSVFCFLDLLGYREFASNFATDEEAAERLTALSATLERGAALLVSEERQEWVRPFRGSDDHALKSFTDNIVIGLPINDDGEVEAGEAFDRIAQFQLEMVKSGFFVRGAMSFGPVYINDLAVFGKPLIEAYQAEATVARVPRVILTSSAKELVELHMGYYGNRPGAPATHSLSRDDDGEWFINYLDSTIIDAEYGEIDFASLASHRDIVREKLVAYANNPSVRSKYEWTARYHNWFIAKYDQVITNDYLINIDEILPVIGQITDDLEPIVYMDITVEEE